MRFKEQIRKCHVDPLKQTGAKTELERGLQIDRKSFRQIKTEATRTMT